jgi:hypothetical protein
VVALKTVNLCKPRSVCIVSGLVRHERERERERALFETVVDLASSDQDHEGIVLM